MEPVVKKLMSKLVMAAALAFAAATPSKAVTYNLVFDGTIFDVNATVTTDTNNNATAISGTMVGPNNYVGQITGLIPFSSPSYHNLWIWNNRFAAATPHVDWYGLLWTTADGTIANYFFDAGHHILSVANPSQNNYNNWINGDTGVHSVSTVPLPGAVWLLGSGLMGLAQLSRRRKLNAISARTV
jgi:hypothetical protein